VLLTSKGGVYHRDGVGPKRGGGPAFGVERRGGRSCSGEKLTRKRSQNPFLPSSHLNPKNRTHPGTEDLPPPPPSSVGCFFTILQKHFFLAVAILLFLGRRARGAGAVCVRERLEYVVERLRRRGCGGAGNGA